jgi:hypothetical protein
VALSLCTITGTLYNADGTAAANVRLQIAQSRENLVAFAIPTVNDGISSVKTNPSNSDGVISFTLPRGATVKLQGKVFVGGQSLKAGVDFAIPDAATATLETLTPVVTVPQTNLSNHAAAEVLAREQGDADTLEAANDYTDAQIAAIDLTSAIEAATATASQRVNSDTILTVGAWKRLIVLIDTATQDVNVTCPTAAALGSRELLFKKKADDNTAIIDGNGSETIDDRLVYNLEMLNEFVQIEAAGGALHVTGKG